MIKNLKVKCLWNANLFLGESALWVPKLNSIFFVDIKKKKIFSLNINTNKKEIFRVNKLIGFICHFKENIFILGLKSELRFVNLKSGKTIYSLKIESNKPNNRINDGKTDSQGRLWFGTMDNNEKKKCGSLYCLDNYLILHKVDTDYFITNGPAFLDKNSFYHTDSKKKIIYKIKINNNFKIIRKKVFIKFNKGEGSPDGMTTDNRNNLWVCHYHGAAISVFNKSGKKIHKINLPAKNITNCTFGGIKNDVIFITSARKGSGKNDLIKYPLSGSLFKARLNLKGKKTKSFKFLI